MISRRPNRWESSENAPGPRKAIAAAIMVTKKVTRRKSNQFGLDPGTQENAMPMLPRPVKTAVSGVRNPITSKAPLAIAGTPNAHVRRVWPPQSTQ